VFEAVEDAIGFEQAEDLLVEFALASVLKMMDGEAGDDDVESASQVG
jgi:hypothetical protein